MKYATILFLLIDSIAMSRPFNLTFGIPTSATNGFAYHCNFSWEATNSVSITYLVTAPQGATNVTFDSTNIPVNPVYLVGTTVDSNNNVSGYSSPFLFDTNNYPLPVVLPMPTPPTIKGVSQVITILVP